MDPKALFQITYGLYVLTTRQDGRNNGLIINTVMQIAEEPNRLAITISKRNHSCQMLRETGIFNVSTRFGIIFALRFSCTSMPLHAS